MLAQDNSTSEPVTIDKVLNALNHWRENKHDYAGPGIPNEVWLLIFQLENKGHSVVDLRRIFSLSTTQYSTKKKQLINTEPGKPLAVAQKKQSGGSPIDDGDIKFCEATGQQNVPAQSIPSLTETASQNKKAVTQLKSTNNNPESFLDLTTIIVECIRPDGHRMKIHTTTKSIDKVMQGFFLQGGDES